MLFDSMMASPSSTAAYLMHSSPWHDGAETYFRRAMSSGAGKGNGGIPSAFPSSIFELTWTLSTLLEANFSSEELGSQALSQIAEYLEKHLNTGHGVIGFGRSS